MSIFTDMKIWAYIRLRKKNQSPNQFIWQGFIFVTNNEVDRHRKVERYMSKEVVSR